MPNSTVFPALYISRQQLARVSLAKQTKQIQIFPTILFAAAAAATASGSTRQQKQTERWRRLVVFLSLPWLLHPTDDAISPLLLIEGCFCSPSFSFAFPFNRPLPAPPSPPQLLNLTTLFPRTKWNSLILVANFLRFRTKIRFRHQGVRCVRVTTTGKPCVAWEEYASHRNRAQKSEKVAFFFVFFP